MTHRLFALAVAARLPHGMFSISVLVHVASATDSYAVAGVCAAVLALGQALGGPLSGRMADRHGQTVVLAGCILVCSSALIAIAQTRDSAAWFMLWAAVAGGFAPPVGPCVRALVPVLVPDPEAQRRVYAADAAATEVTWVAGPVLTFAAVGLAGDRSALVLAATLLLVAAGAFAASAASRRWRPSGMAAPTGGALQSRPLRILVLALVGVGLLFGATEVAVTAVSEALGRPGAAGPLLGLWGLGSLLGGVVATRFGGGARTARGLAQLLALLGVGHAGLAVAPDRWLLLGLLMVTAGSMIAPVLATAYGFVDQIAVAGTTTEAFAWLATATAVGTAVGAAAAGALAEAGGAAAGFLLAGIAALVAAALVARRLPVTTPPSRPATAHAMAA